MVRELTIAANTPISVRLVTPIASDKSNIEDPITATVAKPLVVSGITVVPAGAEVTGSVLETHRSGRVKGRASVVFQFDRLVVRGESHRIQTTRITREAESKKGDDVKKGAIGAGVGAIVGGVAGGGTGAAVGGVVGGTGTILATRGREVELPEGTTVATRLREPLKVLVPVPPK
jgi:hypothetical protein